MIDAIDDDNDDFEVLSSVSSIESFGTGDFVGGGGVACAQSPRSHCENATQTDANIDRARPCAAIRFVMMLLACTLAGGVFALQNARYELARETEAHTNTASLLEALFWQASARDASRIQSLSDQLTEANESFEDMKSKMGRRILALEAQLNATSDQCCRRRLLSTATSVPGDREPTVRDQPKMTDVVKLAIHDGGSITTEAALEGEHATAAAKFAEGAPMQEQGMWAEASMVQDGRPATFPTQAPASANSCPSTCHGYTCDHWIWYTCSEMEGAFGCDCAGCSRCSPTAALKKKGLLEVADYRAWPAGVVMGGAFTLGLEAGGSAGAAVESFAAKPEPEPQPEATPQPERQSAAAATGPACYSACQIAAAASCGSVTGPQFNPCYAAAKSACVGTCAPAAEPEPEPGFEPEPTAALKLLQLAPGAMATAQELS